LVPWKKAVIIWVCLKIGYIPNYSHLIGIMISKTIGFRGTLFSDTPISSILRYFQQISPFYECFFDWIYRILTDNCFYFFILCNDK
jgi:hypothetical protein